MSRAAEQTTIRLRHGDQGEVWVESDDENRFLMTVEAVVRACKTHGRFAEVGKQLRKLARKLTEWLDVHPEDIQEAYLTVRDSGLLFLIVRKTKPFNEALEDALTELDLEIANDETLDLIRFSVLALPATSVESVQSFLAAEPFEVDDAH
ncbi:MAG: hypothetical protein ACYC3I_17265 [Gemmataceae bacterium]